MAEDASEAARRWLAGNHRTWRWNEGTYAGKNRYQAVETREGGLAYFEFDGTTGGLGEPVVQSFAAFRTDGPLRPLPRAVLEELRSWLRDRTR